MRVGVVIADGLAHQDDLAVGVTGTNLLDDRANGIDVSVLAYAADHHQVGVVVQHVRLDAVLLLVPPAAGASPYRRDKTHVSPGIHPLYVHVEKRIAGVVDDAVSEHDDFQVVAGRELRHGVRDVLVAIGGLIDGEIEGGGAGEGVIKHLVGLFKIDPGNLHVVHIERRVGCAGQTQTTRTGCDRVSDPAGRVAETIRPQAAGVLSLTWTAFGIEREAEYTSRFGRWTMPTIIGYADRVASGKGLIHRPGI